MIRSKGKLACLALGCTVVMYGGTAAIAQDTTDETIRSLPSIDVRGLLPEDIRYAPGAATMLTDQEIEEYRPYTLHDAFDFVPGVRTIDDDTFGRRSGIGVRGAPPRRSRKTLLLEDGTPVNASTYLDSSAHYTPPVQRLERIEVLKGTGQILHGPLNNHGIVNFRNKQATLTPETTIEVGGGTHSTFNRHLMHRRTIGPVGVVLSYTGQNADGVFDTEELQWDDFYGSLNWDINPQHNLGVSFTHFRERFDGYDESNLTPQEWFAGRTSKRDRGWGQEFNNFNLNFWKGDIVHDFQITDKWSSSTRFFVTHTDRPRFTVVPGDSVSTVGDLPDIVPSRPFVRGVEGRMESRDRVYQTHGIENRMELADIQALGLNHNFQWGVRYEWHDFDDRRFRADGGEVMDIDNRDGNNLEFRRHEQYSASAVSGFFQNAMQFGNWTVTPGVRVEWFEQTYVRKNIPLDMGNDPKEKSDHTLVLPGISFLYDGFRDTQVFASVMRGYSPAIARTASGFPLEPEIGINSQIGFRSNLFRGVSFEVAGFYNMLKDTIVRETFTIDGLNITVNAGDSDAIGVDVGLRFDSNTYTGSPYNVFGVLAYNYTDARFTSGTLDGNRVPEIPLHAGSFTLGLEHTSGWNISGTVSHFGNFFTDAENTKRIILADGGVELGPGDNFSIREPEVRGRVPSHTIFSARASYTMGGTLANMPGSVTFWIQGRNLTNQLYIADVENGIRPGADRTVVGGVTVKF